MITYEIHIKRPISSKHSFLPITCNKLTVQRNFFNCYCYSPILHSVEQKIVLDLKIKWNDKDKISMGLRKDDKKEDEYKIHDSLRDNLTSTLIFLFSEEANKICKLGACAS